MSEQEKHSGYVVLGPCGDAFHFETREGALENVQEQFLRRLWDFHRHQMPVRVTSEMHEDVEYEVYEIGQRVKLPLQDWADESYAQSKADQRKEMIDRFDRYVSERLIFEGDAAVAGVPLMVFTDDQKVAFVAESVRRAFTRDTLTTPEHT